MKKYTKPNMEILQFKSTEKIAAGSVFDYTDNSAVPVTMYEVTTTSWGASS